MDTQPKTTQLPDGSTVHYVIDALIERNGRYLLVDRLKKPLGYAGVAGHIDEGETAEQALMREVNEESGLTIVSFKLIDETLWTHDACSRGISAHHRKLYRCETTGEPTLKPDEAKTIGWYTPEQIKKLTLEPIWTFWFKKLGVI